MTGIPNSFRKWPPPPWDGWKSSSELSTMWMTGLLNARASLARLKSEGLIESKRGVAMAIDGAMRPVPIYRYTGSDVAEAMEEARSHDPVADLDTNPQDDDL